MNRVMVVGRLGKDPETKVVGDGVELTTFSIASDRFVKKGEDKATDWFNCSAFGSRGAFMAKYAHKGSQVVVVGQMQSNKKDDKTYWNVFVEDVKIVDSKAENKVGEQSNVQREEFVQDDDLPF